MQIFPAIDMIGGQAVRLTRGDYNAVTVYNPDPAAQARQFYADGARCLHLVDLDGAKSGTAENYAAIRSIVQAVPMYIEVGGGIRTEQRICDYLEMGVSRCILGTVAVQDFDFTARMIQKYGEAIAVGVDARDGKVAVNGWLETSSIDGVDFCRRLYDAGCSAVIYTDIARDGAMQGTNLPLYQRLAREIPGLKITASGGICSLRELETLRQMGTAAAILGKSLYTGALNLAEVIQKVQVEK